MEEGQRDTSGAELNLVAVLAEAEEILAAARQGSVPGRVLTTLLFCDIVDSTARVCNLGDRRWTELLAAYHTMIRCEIARHHGTVIHTAGGSCSAAFQSPSLALGCALAVDAATAPLGLWLRMGLHTGECQRLGTKLAGIAVHVGAEIAALAEAGEVLVSGTVRDVVAGAGFVFAERAVNNLPGQLPLYALVARVD